VQDDALEYPLEDYDLLWAGPVCKRFSSATRTAGTRELWPDQIAPIRERLKAAGVPYIVENVPGAPLHSPLLLCGAMFGLKTYRHRLFESNVLLLAPPHLKHTAPVVKMGRPPQAGDFINPVGNFSGVAYARDAMGIAWMTQAELSQAIPPAYSEFLGRQVMAYLQAGKAA
jgi:DNA (cytosine-5)-methyltransferase 1